MVRGKQKKNSKKKVILAISAIFLIGIGWAFATYKVGGFICWVTNKQVCTFNMPPPRPAPLWISSPSSANN